MTALYGAIRVHHPELARILLEAGAHDDDNNALYCATEDPTSATTIALLEGGVKPGTIATLHHIGGERRAAFPALLDHGADVDGENPNDGERLLSAAIECDASQEIAEVLLDRGAQFDYARHDGWSPVRLAAVYGRDRIRQRLRELGAKDELSEEDRLLMAIAANEVEPRTSLLQNGADPGSDEDTLFPLHLAAERGDFEIVRLLADAGARIDLTGEDGAPSAAERLSAQGVSL